MIVDSQNDGDGGTAFCLAEAMLGTVEPKHYLQSKETRAHTCSCRQEGQGKGLRFLNRHVWSHI